MKIRCHLAWLLCPWCMRIVKHSMGFVIWIVLFVWLVWVHCFWSDVLLTGLNFCHWPNNDVFPECPTPADAGPGMEVPGDSTSQGRDSVNVSGHAIPAVLYGNQYTVLFDTELTELEDLDGF